MSRGRGRPSSYKEAYCNEIIECLAEGHSITGFAGSIGVDRTTVFDWLKRHEEFAAAYEIAKSKAVYYWEKEGKRFARDGKGNAAYMIFALCNRAPEDWRQKVEHEHSGKDGGAIAHVVEVTFVEPKGTD